METLNPVQRRIHQAALRLFAEKGASQVNISDLAQEAGVARGTIYNNLQSIDDLFQHVASHLSAEMHQRVVKSFGETSDPALRLANGIRFFIRRAHEEPHWGAFISRFSMSEESLRGMWFGPPTADLLSGLAGGRYSFRQEQLPSVISMIAGSVLSSIFLVLEGHRTWRQAGSDAAELTLRALGVASEEARSLSTGELPPLPPAD
ncbi:TetR/AcrR family transcriptional regulator [Pseudomonas sp. PDM18]|uniref:TetR/AcrR family transcriptional regulator n=1 Tax=Pseudomonas sp. PDM18 TaxID=2769253 RepID=UPI0017808B94|nr:TetR/AcrR family transcriptional regulator [Pseudomonas sp. PDM18]MBD9679282.1 TetR/AcrR family transcriptional regulator [Pseudomonas sp. PDM18]